MTSELGADCDIRSRADRDPDADNRARPDAGTGADAEVHAAPTRETPSAPKPDPTGASHGNSAVSPTSVPAEPVAAPTSPSSPSPSSSTPSSNTPSSNTPSSNTPSNTPPISQPEPSTTEAVEPVGDSIDAGASEPVSPPPAETGGSLPIRGQVVVGDDLYFDSDVSNRDNARLSNDDAPGQPIAAPAMVAGYIGPLRSLDRRDEVSLTPDDLDYYQVSLLEGQAVRLTHARPRAGASLADLDLFLVDPVDQIILDDSQGVGGTEEVVAPATGDHLVVVRRYIDSEEPSDGEAVYSLIVRSAAEPAVESAVEPPPNSNVGIIYVLAVDRDDGQVRAQTTAEPAEGYEFSFDVPAGNYYLVAGSDISEAMTIGAEGDYYGQWSALGQLTCIAVGDVPNAPEPAGCVDAQQPLSVVLGLQLGSGPDIIRPWPQEPVPTLPIWQR